MPGSSGCNRWPQIQAPRFAAGSHNIQASAKRTFSAQIFLRALSYLRSGFVFFAPCRPCQSREKSSCDCDRDCKANRPNKSGVCQVPVPGCRAYFVGSYLTQEQFAEVFFVVTSPIRSRHNPRPAQEEPNVGKRGVSLAMHVIVVK